MEGRVKIIGPDMGTLRKGNDGTREYIVLTGSKLHMAPDPRLSLFFMKPRNQLWILSLDRHISAAEKGLPSCIFALPIATNNSVDP